MVEFWLSAETRQRISWNVCRQLHSANIYTCQTLGAPGILCEQSTTLSKESVRWHIQDYVQPSSTHGEALLNFGFRELSSI